MQTRLLYRALAFVVVFVFLVVRFSINVGDQPRQLFPNTPPPPPP